MTETSSVKPKLQMVVHFAFSGVAFGLAWWLWHLGGHNPWATKFLGGTLAIGGVIRMGNGLFISTELLLKSLSNRKYKSKVKTQKADSTVSSAELKAKGLIE